jgi:formylglycine-generating enzyme required for sulfatase activity
MHSAWQLARRFVCAAIALSSASCELLIEDVTLDPGSGKGDCTVKRPGPTMLRIDARAGSYCIDSTEVTVAQFNEYLVASSEQFEEPAFCSGSFALPVRVSDPSLFNRPATGVSPCHAWSYCRWAGKRLCGSIPDGAAIGFEQDPATTEWVNACQNGASATRYPYGDVYEPGTCQTETEASADVASSPACHGTTPPYALLFDMSGNVAEYVNEFSAQASIVVGGSFRKDAAATTCLARGGYNAVATIEIDAGFRCCASYAPASGAITASAN